MFMTSLPGNILQVSANCKVEINIVSGIHARNVLYFIRAKYYQSAKIHLIGIDGKTQDGYKSICITCIIIK